MPFAASLPLVTMKGDTGTDASAESPPTQVCERCGGGFILDRHLQVAESEKVVKNFCSFAIKKKPRVSKVPKSYSGKNASQRLIDSYLKISLDKKIAENRRELACHYKIGRVLELPNSHRAIKVSKIPRSNKRASQRLIDSYQKIGLDKKIEKNRAEELGIGTRRPASHVVDHGSKTEKVPELPNSVKKAIEALNDVFEKAFLEKGYVFPWAKIVKDDLLRIIKSDDPAAKENNLNLSTNRRRMAFLVDARRRRMSVAKWGEAHP